MAKREVTSVLVRMPAKLKRRLAREVSRREATLNDVAVELLAGRFRVSFQPSGRRGSTPGDSPSVLLRMPPALHERLRATADERATSTNAVIVATLEDALGDHQREDTMAQTDGKQNGRA